MSYNELEQRGTEEFPFELYHIESRHTRYEMSAHWHNEVEIIRVLQGTLHIRLNNNRYEVQEGELIFINPETVHQASPIDCVYECIVFSPDAISVLNHTSASFIDSLKNHEYAIEEHYPAVSDSFSSVVHALFKAMAAPAAGREFKVFGILAYLFGEIIDRHLYRSAAGTPLVDKQVPKLRAALLYIRSHYHTAITLDSMAAAVGMSPKYFCAFFKEMTAKTPVEYLTLYRIEKASRKLINTDSSVTAIAYACGFNDLSYFIKTFKQIKGITPAKFRKNALQ